MIVHYESPSFVFGDKTVSTVILGWPNPKSRPSRPSLIGLLPYCCVPCPQSPFTGRPTRSGPEHKNRKKHIGHGARFNDYTGRKHSDGILCPPALCPIWCSVPDSAGLWGCWSPPRFLRRCPGLEALPARHQRHHQSLQGCADIKQPDIQRLASGSCLGEEGVKVCQDDMCTDLKGHLLEFWGSQCPLGINGRTSLHRGVQPISNSPTSKDLLPYLRLGLPGLSASIASLNWPTLQFVHESVRILRHSGTREAPL